jgi:hypothetical protein
MPVSPERVADETMRYVSVPVVVCKKERDRACREESRDQPGCGATETATGSPFPASNVGHVLDLLPIQSTRWPRETEAAYESNLPREVRCMHTLSRSGTLTRRLAASVSCSAGHRNDVTRHVRSRLAYLVKGCLFEPGLSRMNARAPAFRTSSAGSSSTRRRQPRHPQVLVLSVRRPASARPATLREPKLKRNVNGRPRRTRRLRGA